MELTTPLLIAAAAAVFVVAMLYSSVGHGGASGYLAVMSLLPVRPGEMSTTALVLNVLVASIALTAFLRAGHLSGRLTWPFVAAGVPAAFVGGLWQVENRVYWMLLAITLVVAAFRLAMPERRAKSDPRSGPPPPMIAFPAAASVGLLSGTVGIGGGVFLSPLILLAGWADAKPTSATAACFIVANSAAGLCGRMMRGGLVIGPLAPLVAAAFLGGSAGSYFGANAFPSSALRRLLAPVLLFAALRLALKL